MFIHAQQALTISRPEKAVFALICDPTKEPQWNPAVLRVECLSEPAGGVGTRYRETHRVIFRKNTMTFEVLDYQPGTLFGIKTLSGGPLQISRYLLEALPDTVQVTLSIDIQIPSILRFLAPLLRRFADEEALNSLTRLKQFLENESPQSPPSM